MADQALTPVALTVNTASAAIAAGATGKIDMTSSNDGVITPTSDKMVIVLYDAGGAGGTVLIKAGTNAPLASQGDITVTLGASETKAVYVESARCKYQSGAYKNTIRMDASVNVTGWAYALP